MVVYIYGGMGRGQVRPVTHPSEIPQIPGQRPLFVGLGYDLDQHVPPVGVDGGQPAQALDEV